MKKLLILSLITLAFVSCDKDDNPQTTNPVNQLPAATQIGANTFGCLLDGKVFKPGNGANPLDCVYQFIDGGYYFSLQANRRDQNNIPILLGCSSQNLQIFEGQTYLLKEKIDIKTYEKVIELYNLYKKEMN